MPEITRGLQGAEYIGDGVYVGHDGYHIWLRTERSSGIHEIALEPPVFVALLDWWKRLVPAKHEDP